MDVLLLHCFICHMSWVFFLYVCMCIGFLKVWQPRYFKLFSDGLHYFKDKKAVEAQGIVPLFAITAVEIPAGKSKEGDRFDVSVGDTKKDKKGGRIFSLRADSAADCAVRSLYHPDTFLFALHYLRSLC
jgi:hypothetical protein